MTTQPCRCWFRFAFGLRTLFVLVTIFGVWLGWQRHSVQERRSLIKELESNYPGKQTGHLSIESVKADPDWFNRVKGSYIRVSALRRLLGDESYLDIDMPDTVDSKLVDRIEHAFPEAELSIYGTESSTIEAFRASLYLPIAEREPNIGNVFKTGLIEKSPEGASKP